MKESSTKPIFGGFRDCIALTAMKTNKQPTKVPKIESGLDRLDFKKRSRLARKIRLSHRKVAKTKK